MAAAPGHLRPRPIRATARLRTRALAAALSGVVALLVLVAFPGSAAAIPAFARKYQTSCQTCHAPFPALSPFGEAFRRSGFRFPEGEDEDAAQEATVPLGQEAHKKVFPHEVWPATIPASIPLAVIMAGRIEFDPEATPETAPEANLTNLFGNLGLRLSTTFDETFSVWAGVDINAGSGSEAQVSLDRAYLFIKPFDEPVLNVRLGRFEPGLLGFSMHRLIGLTPWLTTTPVGDDSFVLEPLQTGAEATGVVGCGRLAHTVGMVEGGGDRVNTEKDVYARLSYKLGGMRLDGVGGATDTLPWRETSLQMGAFSYFGRAALGDPQVASQEDSFALVGADVNLALRDLRLTSAAAFARHQRPSLAEPLEEQDVYHVFAQLDYVVHPFMFPTLRYERRAGAEPVGDRLSTGFYGLVRPNIRAHALVSVEREGTDHFVLGKIILGLNTVY